MLSPRVMLILAQSLLVMGGFSLVYASARLFLRAFNAGMPIWHLFWVIPVAVALGASKAVFVMRKRLRVNIARLCAVEGKLWPWQIYPPQLAVFVLSMMVMMFVLKRILVGNAVGLGVLGAIDVMVAVALLVSSLEYRQKEC